MTWILNVLSQPIAQSMIWLNTAKDIWNILRVGDAHGDAFYLSDLTEEFCAMKQGANDVN